MKTVKIPVAAPEAGLYFDNRSEKTGWQEYSDTFKALGRPRMFWQSGKNERPYVNPDKKKK
jgi:hypothetical protein